MSASQNGSRWPIDHYEELAKHYDKTIGSIDQRTDMYKNFFADILKQHNCRYILDASCGTGVDSIILIEHGFKVVSVDLSAPMLKCARDYRARMRGHPPYDEWVIEQASWETLPHDLSSFLPPGTQFDAVVCLANSISHILNDDGDHMLQKKCLNNLVRCVKPGGILVVDHRNYDAMLNDEPPAVGGNVYYKYQNPVDIRSKLVMKDGRPEKVLLKFFVQDETGQRSFSLSCYPHRLESFSRLVREAVQCDLAEHRVYGDFRPLGEVPSPGFYQHVIVKKGDPFSHKMT